VLKRATGDVEATVTGG